MSFLQSETHRKIESFAIDAKDPTKFINDVQEYPNGENWPVVYILDNSKKKLLYVGESTSATRRMKEHFSKANRNYNDRIQLNRAHIIFDDTFNKSAILDIEQELIRMFGADSSGYTLQNRNDGQSVQHQYYDRDQYNNSLKFIWKELKNNGLAKDSFEDVRNSNLFKYSPFTALTDEQERICNEILDNLIKSLCDKKKFNAVIEGVAGTGKTVVLIKVLSELVRLSKLTSSVSQVSTNGKYDDDSEELVLEEKQKEAERISQLKRFFPDGLKIAYVVPAYVVPLSELIRPFKKVIKAVCGDDSIVKTATEVAKTSGDFDIIFVDEAHRLGSINKFGANKKPYKEACKSVLLAYEKGMINPPTELDWIVEKTNNCVFVYDQEQKVRNYQSISHSNFENAILDKEYTTTYTLIKQMRCQAGNKYVQFLDNFFKNEPLSTSLLPPWKGYDFRVYDDINQMVQAVNERNAKGKCGLSRVVAGYGWKWKTNGKNRDTILSKGEWDINIKGHQYFWNVQSGNFIFEADENEIGCVHTVQGFDLNYVGVIFGPEIRYEKNSGFYIDKNYLYDSGVKSKSAEEQLELTIRAYKVMMERGIKGCYVYACDPGLQEYLKENIPSVSEAIDNLDITVEDCIDKLTGLKVSGSKRITNTISLRKVDVDAMLNGHGSLMTICTIEADNKTYYVTNKRISDDNEYYIFDVTDTLPTDIDYTAFLKGLSSASDSSDPL